MVLVVVNHLLIYAQEYPGRVVVVGTELSVKRAAMRKLARIGFGACTGPETESTIQIVQSGGEAASTMISGFWLFLVITAFTLPVQLYYIERYDRLLFLVVLGGYAVLFLMAQLLMRISQAIGMRGGGLLDLPDDAGSLSAARGPARPPG